jgi:pilus assembly protein CpaC
VTPYLVKPIDNEADIHLPTDGFQTANGAEQLLGNFENDGISGAARPMPHAVEPAAPPPAVGLIDQGQPALASDDKDRRKDTKVARNAAPATPGFSLK